MEFEDEAEKQYLNEGKSSEELSPDLNQIKEDIKSSNDRELKTIYYKLEKLSNKSLILLFKYLKGNVGHSVIEKPKGESFYVSNTGSISFSSYEVYDEFVNKIKEDLILEQGKVNIEATSMSIKPTNISNPSPSERNKMTKKNIHSNLDPMGKSLAYFFKAVLGNNSVQTELFDEYTNTELREYITPVKVNSELREFKIEPHNQRAYEIKKTQLKNNR